MQFLLIVYKNLERFAQLPDTERHRVSKACDTWFETLQRTGQGVEMNRLQATSTATTLRKSNGNFLVMDGPFAETKEVFAGYVIVDCRDRLEALELAKTFPVVETFCAVEVRPIVGGGENQLCDQA